jgi:hypothetical protein
VHGHQSHDLYTGIAACPYDRNLFHCVSSSARQNKKKAQRPSSRRENETF